MKLFRISSITQSLNHSITALTLIELLVALTILVSISASTVLIFRGVTRAWRTGSLRTERYQQARLLFDLFNRELSSTVASRHYPLVGLKRLEASPLHDGPAAQDELMFVGTFSGRAGFIERGYWVDSSGDFMCHDDDSGDGDYATGTSDLCAQDVASFTVTYFDGTAWLDHWEAHIEGDLPKAIRIELALGRGKPETFQTVIYVPTS